MRFVIALIAIVLALIPVAASADTVFLPVLHNGVRNWFTVADVVAWSAAANNVMPIYCNGPQDGIFTECTVQQAQPVTLVWDNDLGKVIAK